MKIEQSLQVNSPKHDKKKQKAEEFCSVFIYEMLKNCGTEHGESSAEKMYNDMRNEEYAKIIIKNKKLQEKLVDPVMKKLDENRP